MKMNLDLVKTKRFSMLMVVIQDFIFLCKNMYGLQIQYEWQIFEWYLYDKDIKLYCRMGNLKYLFIFHIRIFNCKLNEKMSN